MEKGWKGFPGQPAEGRNNQGCSHGRPHGGDPEPRSGWLQHFSYDITQSLLKISSWHSLLHHHGGKAGNDLNLVRSCKVVRTAGCNISPFPEEGSEVAVGMEEWEV